MTMRREMGCKVMSAKRKVSHEGFFPLLSHRPDYYHFQQEREREREREREKIDLHLF